jgi:digalactosyldiacylglycerol synthase
MCRCPLSKQISLLVPWLARCDQDLVFPNNLSFDGPEAQAACMREWVKQRTGLSPEFDILWYPGALACSDPLFTSCELASLGLAARPWDSDWYQHTGPAMKGFLSHLHLAGSPSGRRP